MKKKGVTILLFAVMLLVFLTGCNADGETPPTTESIPTLLIMADESAVDSVDETLFEPAENLELKFRATNKTYTPDGFGEEFFIYRFGSPNEHIVVYHITSSVYLLGMADSEIGQCYALYRMPNGEFVGLSNNYMLFKTDQGLVAVEIDQSQYVLEKTIGEQYSFDSLSEKEQSSFVSPITCEKIAQ